MCRNVIQHDWPYIWHLTSSSSSTTTKPPPPPPTTTTATTATIVQSQTRVFSLLSPNLSVTLTQPLYVTQIFCPTISPRAVPSFPWPNPSNGRRLLRMRSLGWQSGVTWQAAFGPGSDRWWMSLDTSRLRLGILAWAKHMFFFLAHGGIIFFSQMPDFCHFGYVHLKLVLFVSASGHCEETWKDGQLEILPETMFFPFKKITTWLSAIYMSHATCT